MGKREDYYMNLLRHAGGCYIPSHVICSTKRPIGLTTMFSEHILFVSRGVGLPRVCWGEYWDL